ncbi:hypothetical protein H2201_000903 [Coniosporium apollinis]|uniref:DUF6594 domain-containing protein n=1 Tax=Coniosporium apollinis TaxID=61459 RepID=A0ABQ9P399_9PEZI|nr:hypothetical protein H2201_000903 [Coniosporium apollinis]
MTDDMQYRIDVEMQKEPAQLPDPVPGYPQLAERMGTTPEATILRRFAALNVRNLLCLQAELHHLERDLVDAEIADSRSEEGWKSKYSSDWFWLNEPLEGKPNHQWQLMLKIRERLKEYNEALIQQSQLITLPKPGKRDLLSLQCWLTQSDRGAGALIGPDVQVWGDIRSPGTHYKDLIALKARQVEDPFFRLVSSRFLGWKPSRIHPGFGYEEFTLMNITAIVTSLVAPLLPIASIAILCAVQSTSSRIAVIAALNFVFSFCLMAFARARRTEVFAATAAFAAVQVVFVGTSEVSQSRLR